MKRKDPMQYARISERLRELGMSWADLEELVEAKTGIPVGYGYIKRQVKKGYSLSWKKRQAMVEILGEEVVYGKRIWFD